MRDRTYRNHRRVGGIRGNGIIILSSPVRYRFQHTMDGVIVQGYVISKIQARKRLVMWHWREREREWQALVGQLKLSLDVRISFIAIGC